MDKCPYCGAKTQPGDNFCLNCGNRLLSGTPSSPQLQAQPGMGDATEAEQENWGGAHVDPAVVPTSGANWEQASSGPAYEATVREPVASVQATMDRLPEPGRFILRSDSGEVLQEYPLDKNEIVIGRAPNSDILLSKDKLTSRRHATVYYEQGKYLLRDEHSANGTFVNGEQLEEATPYELKDGDQVGIGEHELVFRVHGSTVADVEDLPTIAGPVGIDETFATREDEMATASSVDDYGTQAIDEGQQSETPQPVASTQEEPEEHTVFAAQEPVYTPTPIANYAAVPTFNRQEEPVFEPEEEPVVNSAPPVEEQPEKTTYAPSAPSSYVAPTSNYNYDSEESITFNRFSVLSTPALPDMSALMAALSTLDGQVMALQEQINATQEAIHGHDNEVVQTANNLRSGIRRVSDRMDTTIAEVARSREALAWAELLQLMEDVMNNPRDIEYVTKLARKARELNKVFQIHQNVLNTMAECNSLLRSMIGEEKK